MSLERVNRMRRLLEYRAQLNRNRHVQEETEHLQILDLLERGEVVAASYRLRQHLAGALERKTRGAIRESETEEAAL